MSTRRTAITIGNFDGVHLGHQRILALTLEMARKRGAAAIAFTFRPHPQVALRPEVNLPLLSTYDEKLRLLKQSGVDQVIEQPFSREFSNTPPEEFFNEYLIKTLQAEAIIVGYDFGFGKERAGQLENLEKLCRAAGVELTVVPAYRVDGEVVSSSGIRQHLQSARIRNANRLLGREFSYSGTVIRGDGRGKTIGFPTANLRLEYKLALPYGVYATHAVVGDRVYPSVTNVGVRPTFESSDQLPVRVETYILDETIDLYGSNLEVRFVEHLREEKKFPDIAALTKQIGVDVQAARAILKK